MRALLDTPSKRLSAAIAAAVVLLAAAAWLHRPAPVDSSVVPDRYDHRFKKYSKRYFSVLSDWRWFKAQSMTESNLRPDAESGDGAIGVMQILPDTFGEVVDYDPGAFNIADPKWNIAAGIAFNRYLYGRWSEWVPPEQRLNFTFASYNAGLTRMLKVQKQAAAGGRDPDAWHSVARYAPGETRTYVERVNALMGREAAGQ